jgi:hypothetical protein
MIRVPVMHHSGVTRRGPLGRLCKTAMTSSASSMPSSARGSGFKDFLPRLRAMACTHRGASEPTCIRHCAPFETAAGAASSG